MALPMPMGQNKQLNSQQQKDKKSNNVWSLAATVTWLSPWKSVTDLPFFLVGLCLYEAVMSGAMAACLEPCGETWTPCQAEKAKASKGLGA